MQEREPAAESGTEAGLRCLDGQAAPADLINAWRRYLELPEALHAQIGQALTPVLLDLPQETLQQHVSQLAGTHGVQASDVALALDGCRALVAKAAAHDLDASAFDADLKTLTGAESAATGRTALVGQYGEAKRIVQSHYLRDSVAEHGNVLTGISWRVDRILASSKGLGLNTNILMMTLLYQDKGAERQLTLQATDETLHRLRDFCDQMLRLGAETSPRRE